MTPDSRSLAQQVIAKGELATAGPHTVSITLESNGVNYTWHCSAEVGAPCRLECPEGCEYFEYEGHEHELRDSGECLIIVWMEEDDATNENLAPDFEIGTFGFTPKWAGDYYEWSIETKEQ
jgi:hypothetical protein